MICGAYYSPASISRLTDVTAQEMEKWRNRSIKEEYFALHMDATSLRVRRSSAEKEPVYVVVGLNWDGTREILGFWLLALRGRVSSTGKKYLVNLSQRVLKELIPTLCASCCKRVSKRSEKETRKQRQNLLKPFIGHQTGKSRASPY